ncbi:hypothetical protein T439DRAFT_174681 [Meredithblackwellia eburnea MCA 4105]
MSSSSFIVPTRKELTDLTKPTERLVLQKNGVPLDLQVMNADVALHEYIKNWMPGFIYPCPKYTFDLERATVLDPDIVVNFPSSSEVLENPAAHCVPHPGNIILRVHPSGQASKPSVEYILMSFSPWDKKPEDYVRMLEVFPVLRKRSEIHVEEKKGKKGQTKYKTWIVDRWISVPGAKVIKVIFDVFYYKDPGFDRGAAPSSTASFSHPSSVFSDEESIGTRASAPSSTVGEERDDDRYNPAQRAHPHSTPVRGEYVRGASSSRREHAGTRTDRPGGSSVDGNCPPDTSEWNEAQIRTERERLKGFGGMIELCGFRLKDNTSVGRIKVGRWIHDPEFRHWPPMAHIVNMEASEKELRLDLPILYDTWRGVVDELMYQLEFEWVDKLLAGVTIQQQMEKRSSIPQYPAILTESREKHNGTKFRLCTVVFAVRRIARDHFPDFLAIPKGSRGGKRDDLWSLFMRSQLAVAPDSVTYYGIPCYEAGKGRTGYLKPYIGPEINTSTVPFRFDFFD